MAPGNPILRNWLGHGPVIVELQDFKNPENTRRFKMGTYPPTHFDQNTDLLNLILAFRQCSNDPVDCEFMTRLKHQGFLPLDPLRRLAGFSMGPDWTRRPWPDVPVGERERQRVVDA